jgi:hypothetical protein
MGGQYIATVSWGIIINHEDVIRVSDAIEKKRELEGKEPMYPVGEEKEINWEYLDDIFAVPTTKFSISIDIDDVTGESSVMIFHKNGLGSVERWGSDCRFFDDLG